MTRRGLVTVIVLAITPWVQAAQPSSIALDGFGTLGVVHADLDHADFAASSLAPEGAGYTRD